VTAELPDHVFPTFIVGADQPTIEFADGIEFHEPVHHVQCTCGRTFSDAVFLENHLAEVAG